MRGPILELAAKGGDVAGQGVTAQRQQAGKDVTAQAVGRGRGQAVGGLGGQAVDDVDQRRFFFTVTGEGGAAGR